MATYPIYVVGFLFVSIVVLAIVVDVGGMLSDSSSDKVLADNANNIKQAANSLSGIGSSITINVQVPKDSALELVDGYVSFVGKGTNGISKANINCSSMIEQGKYKLRLQYTTTGVNCDISPNPQYSLKQFEDFEDGMAGWETQVSPDYANVIISSFARSSKSVLKIVVNTPKRWSGVKSSNSNLVSVKPNRVYVAEVYVYVPKGVKINGVWEFHRHVYSAGGCTPPPWGGRRTCHHYTILDGDYKIDNNIPRDRWVRKWVKFRTWPDANRYRAFFITSYPSGSGTVYWDDFSIWEATS